MSEQERKAEQDRKDIEAGEEPLSYLRNPNAQAFLDWHRSLGKPTIEQRLAALEAIHQQTTHVHEADMLKRAYELLTRIHEQPQRAIYFQAGLPFDISNWLQRYEKYMSERSGDE